MVRRMKSNWGMRTRGIALSLFYFFFLSSGREAFFHTRFEKLSSREAMLVHAFMVRLDIYIVSFRLVLFFCRLYSACVGLPG